jgi:hypothetical protein
MFRSMFRQMKLDWKLCEPFEQSHPSCFTPGEVESLRCEITVRCVGANVCGFDGDV